MRVPQISLASGNQRSIDDAIAQMIAAGKRLGCDVGKAIAEKSIGNQLPSTMMDEMIAIAIQSIALDLMPANIPEPIMAMVMGEIRLEMTTEIIRQLEILDDGAVSVGGMSR